MKVYRPILGLVESIKALYIPRLGVIGYLTADILTITLMIRELFVGYNNK